MLPKFRIQPRIRGRLGVGAVIALFVPAASQAQVAFQWPSKAITLSRYSTVESCLALVGRVRDSLEGSSSIWRDTLIQTREEGKSALPQAVIEIAQKCSENFNPETAPVKDFHPLAKLYLLANRDADAQRLIARRLESVPDTGKRTRLAIIDTAIGTYINKGSNLSPQPARIMLAHSLLNTLVSDSSVLWQTRGNALLSFVQAAKDMGDTVLAREAANRYISLISNLSEAEQRKTENQTAIQIGYSLSHFTRENELLDSLRKGTAGYVALRQQDWSKLSREKSKRRFIPNGQPAQPIVANVWIGADSSTVRPTKGRVSLITFLDHRSCITFTDCWATYSILKRLASRFPEVEFTVVTQTYGAFGDLEPPTLAQEDSLVQYWWKEKRNIPAVIAVYKTDFWRLPNLDRRRINRDGPNFLNYTFNRQWPLFNGTTFLVDRQGTIVELMGLQRQNEITLSDLIQAVLAQPHTGQ